MRIKDLYNYKDAYKVLRIISDNNHPNLIIKNPLDNNKEFIYSILNSIFFLNEDIKPTIYNEEIYYEYTDIYYYFDIKKIKLDLKNSFTNIIKQITNTYNYFSNQNNYIILDNYEIINPLIENKLKVIVEKSNTTTKFIIFTKKLDKILDAIKSRCIFLRFSPLTLYDKEIIFKEYSHVSDFNKILQEYNDINLITKKLEGYKDPIDIFLKKCIQIFHKKLNKNINEIKELSYNIKNSVLDFTEIQKKIISHYLKENISSEKKYKIINTSANNNYLMINCYKDIIYIEYYLLEIYSILND